MDEESEETPQVLPQVQREQRVQLLPQLQCLSDFLMPMSSQDKQESSEELQLQVQISLSLLHD